MGYLIFLKAGQVKLVIFLGNGAVAAPLQDQIHPPCLSTTHDNY